MTPRAEIFEGKFSEVTGKIIQAFYKVYNALGYGFNERVYGKALEIELRKVGLTVEREKSVHVFYEGQVIGEYFVDLLVNGAVIVELKAVRYILEEHEAQLLNYLKATKIEVGLLMNFGIKPDYKRKVFDNDKKGSLGWIKR
jgi:GxxExxY protein